jgi:beta-glucanase (GH16 family)
MLIVVGVGIYVVYTGRAAGIGVALEPENGTIAAPAVSVTNSTASGGKAVRFTTAPTPPTSGCAVSGVAAPCIGSATTGATGWGTPVFFDEFNGTSLDPLKWSPCWFPGSYSGQDVCGEMNDSRTAKYNVRMENGSVVLRQSSTIENSAQDIGALINTQPSQVGGSTRGFQMGLGYAEARVHFPGNGTNCYNWPAWWINGPQDGFSDGEIDVAEVGGTGYMGSNYHFDRGNGREITQNRPGGYWCDTYHIYGVDRQAGRNVIYWDGRQVASYTTYDNGAPEYLIFNVGYKSGKTPMSGAASDVRVDYVRVWKK